MQVELVNGSSSSHHTVIKVIGVGGGGGNAIHRMIEQGLEGVQFITANTDLQALEYFDSPKAYKLGLGAKTTGGLGAGGNPEIGREAAEEDLEKIKELIQEAHMVFITAGMGGGTGTGAAPIIARAAKEMGKLCVAVVTTPFLFEGQRKLQLAMKGVEALREEVDTLIIIPNQLLLHVLPSGTSVKDAFLQADEILRMGVKGIADLITQPGDINVDFNDVCAIMHNGGDALMGIGYGQGEGRAFHAAAEALQNPLLNGSSMSSATGVLVQISGDPSFTLDEYSLIMNAINEHVDTENATVISGIAIDSTKKDELKVTVIATGFVEEPELEEAFAQSPSAQQQPSQNTRQARSNSPMNTPVMPSINTPQGQYQQSPQMSTAPASYNQRPAEQGYGRQQSLEVDQHEQVSAAELEALMGGNGHNFEAQGPGTIYRQPNIQANPQNGNRNQRSNSLPPSQNDSLYIPTVLRKKRKNQQ